MSNHLILAFRISLFIALLLSFIVFIDAFFYGNKQYPMLFNTWQFPMLLAIFLDSIFVVTPQMYK